MVCGECKGRGRVKRTRWEKCSECFGFGRPLTPLDVAILADKFEAAERKLRRGRYEAWV